MLAIIGGSSLAKLPILEVTHRQIVRTPYGDPSCALTFGRIGQQNVVFIARHGYGNSIAPHEINYRANIWALHSIGVNKILAIGSVGGIRPDMQPGVLVLPDNLLDYTWGRKHTFFEGPDRPIKRVDLSLPYDQTLRQNLQNAANLAGLPIITDGIYAVTQGPRLETAGEIVRLERDGADIVGMTGMPEAALARELDLPYANLSLVVNRAAGRGGAGKPIVLDASIMDQGVGQISRLLMQLLS